MVPATSRMTYAEYLALEAESDLRHEFLDGEVWAMSGGTIRHSALKTRVLARVAAQLGDGPCQPYDSDLRVRVLATGLATYPDLTVVCGPLERDPEHEDTVVNPTLVLEVLSPSTEGWDRGGKFRHLRTTGTLRQYVLVRQDAPGVEVYTRTPETWELREYGPGATVPLASIGVELDVDALYRNLPD